MGRVACPSSRVSCPGVEILNHCFPGWSLQNYKTSRVEFESNGAVPGLAMAARQAAAAPAAAPPALHVSVHKVCAISRARHRAAVCARVACRHMCVCMWRCKMCQRRRCQQHLLHSLSWNECTCASLCEARRAVHGAAPTRAAGRDAQAPPRRGATAPCAHLMPTRTMCHAPRPRENPVRTP